MTEDAHEGMERNGHRMFRSGNHHQDDKRETTKEDNAKKEGRRKLQGKEKEKGEKDKIEKRYNKTKGESRGRDRAQVHAGKRNR